MGVKAEGSVAWSVITVAGILLLATNLRAPITSVGPVIGEIKDQLRLTPALAGLITTIPLMSFALLSSFAPKAARKTGLENLLLYSLIVLGVGLFIRSSGNVFLLFLGAALIGAAITIGNVLMPAFIKREFPKNVGLVTGIYLVSMNLTSALAAGYSIEIGRVTGTGWKGSIGIWIVLTFVALLSWLPQIKKKPVRNVQVNNEPKGSLWKSSLAWKISVFMGLQSFLFYSYAAWLPTVLQSWGMSADRSGWMLSYIQMAQLTPTLVGPIIAAKMKDQRSLVWVTFVLFLLGMVGLLFFRLDYIILSVVLIGFSLGLAFTLAMMFFVLRTKNTSDAADLSGMSQSAGYLIAATGPPLFGALFSLTNNWYVPLVVSFLAGVILFLVGLSSAKNRYV